MTVVTLHVPDGLYQELAEQARRERVTVEDVLLQMAESRARRNHRIEEMADDHLKRFSDVFHRLAQ